MTLRIANGAGFLGDNLDAPRRLAERAEIDYLTLEYLAELTLSILAQQKAKNQSAGFAGDFCDVLRSLEAALVRQPKMKIVTNGGGMNPIACAKYAAEIRVAAGCPDEPIGVVTGDDLLPRIDDLMRQGCDLVNLETGQPLRELTRPIASANVYLGARPICEALDLAARIVITGRVADASLTLGPAMHEFRWHWDDWNRLAGATIAGHLIECGAQVTGGYSTDWQSVDMHDIGYPVAELFPDGNCVITKPEGSTGHVDLRTVSEQLIYEIGDPRHYLTPDVDVDFTTVELREIGADRVAVRNGSGRPAPDTLKVSLAYRNGFVATGQLLVFGKDCVAKAKKCAELIFSRLAIAGFVLDRTNVELLGAGDGVPGLRSDESVSHSSPKEVLLRLSVHDQRQDAVERFTKEFAPLITSGPAGLAGYAASRAVVRPVLAYWPTLVPRSVVTPVVDVRSAKDWLKP